MAMLTMLAAIFAVTILRAANARWSAEHLQKLKLSGEELVGLKGPIPNAIALGQR